MKGRIEGRKGERESGKVRERKGGAKGEWMDGWMDAWRGGWMGGWVG